MPKCVGSFDLPSLGGVDACDRNERKRKKLKLKLKEMSTLLSYVVKEMCVWGVAKGWVCVVRLEEIQESGVVRNQAAWLWAIQASCASRRTGVGQLHAMYGEGRGA